MTSTNSYQVSHNGPLTQEAKLYLLKVKEDNNWSYKSLAKRIGVSEAFAYHIIKKNQNITTATYYKVVEKGIDQLKTGDTSPPTAPVEDGHGSLLDHSYHLREGLQVTFRLPSNLAEKETERLSMFIRSLAH